MSRSSGAVDLVLASASPRRRELFGFLGVPFRVLATDAEEEPTEPPPAIHAALPPLDLPLHDHPTLRAWRKAAAVALHAPGSLILGADTIVVLDGTVLNKPLDPPDAQRMLRVLSGRTHTVYTGVFVLDTRADAAQPFLADLLASHVTVAELSDAEIAGYVASGEPLDKAGAYGIQGLGGRLVVAVEGSYTNVVGLPIVATHRVLTAAGIAVAAEPGDAYRNWLRSIGKEPLPCPPTLP